MADLAGLHQLAHRAKGFLYRRRAAVVAGLEAKLAEVVGGARRPVDLVQVDVVGLEPGQRGIAGSQHAGAIELGPAAHVIHLPRPGDLGRQHDVLPLAGLGEPGADDLFGAAVGFSLRRHRIHLGGVEEVDALAHRVIHLLVAFGLAVLLAPGHGAEADCGNLQIGTA